MNTATIKEILSDVAFSISEEKYYAIPADLWEELVVAIDEFEIENIKKKEKWTNMGQTETWTKEQIATWLSIECFSHRFNPQGMDTIRGLISSLENSESLERLLYDGC